MCYVRERVVEKEMYKLVQNTSAYLGNIQFKLIQFGSDNMPQSIYKYIYLMEDKHSNIPGSPRA